MSDNSVKVNMGAGDECVLSHPARSNDNGNIWLVLRGSNDDIQVVNTVRIFTRCNQNCLSSQPVSAEK